MCSSDLSDTFQSAETQQALAAEGFNTTIISVDRVDSDHICRPYQYLRSTIYEERVECYKTTLLKEEFIGLERDNNSGKVDHSPSGINSKDSADAICGAMWNASQHADEFAIDYGEDFSATIKTSGMSSNYDAEEEALNFENELKNVFAKNLSTSDKTKQMDFGFGPSVPVTGAYISDGILVW